MFANLPFTRSKLLLLIAAMVILVALLIFGGKRYWNNQVKKPYLIGIIINETELPQGGMHSLKEIVAQKLYDINSKNGIDGHPLDVIYLDDDNSDKKLFGLVKESSRDPNLIGYVGCRGLSRTKTIAPILTENNIPLIGLYSFTNYFQQHPTLYTASVGVIEAEEVFANLFKSKGTRIGFIGEKDNLLSQAYSGAIENVIAKNPELSIALRKFYPKGHIYSDMESKALADSLKNKTDFLVFLSNPVSFSSFLNEMKKQNMKIPLFLGAPDYQVIDQNTEGYKASEIYLINAFGIPGAQNMRMMEQFADYYKKEKKNKTVSLELSISVRIADEIGMIQEAAQSNIYKKNLPIREKIINGLKEYKNGNNIYRGWLGDWYFTPEQAYGGEALLAWKPRGEKIMVLAPYQYLRAGNSLRENQVLFTNMDLVKIDQVNDDDGTFFATFYFEIYSPQEISLQNINFTNAARNEINQESLIETKLIRSKKDTVGYKFYNNLYQVSGKFHFEPDLKFYPLDKQKFPISIQASNPNDFFLVQPSQRKLRDTVFKAEGWIYRDQYMGYDQDIISSTDDFYGQNRNIPYYKFSYVYIMQRADIDFFLKTLVPLLAILVIAYFSVYIPHEEFEALAGIQVTALLSSIALYFSVYKPETQYATTSDKIFIFTYIMITTLIGSSILIYKIDRQNTLTKHLVQFYQRYIFPLVVIFFTIYVRWF